MPNTASAKKAVRVIARRTAVNQMRRNRVRTMVRKVEDALKLNDVEAARLAMVVAESALRRAAQKGVMHRKTASRKVSRLARAVNALQTPSS